MLSLQNIGIEYSGKWLLRNASHQFKEKSVTGLIGRNGAGKSSLLRVIAGENLPTEGIVARTKDSKLRYFHQELLSYETERSIFEVAKDAFGELLAIQEKLDVVLTEIENGNQDLALWDDLSHLQSEWEARGGDSLEAQCYETLAGLGFKSHEVHLPYKTFSGGWRMRVLLAKMLLENPDILLLDEPTNHLDLPSIQWLENYLSNFPGICLVVSHDRYFLDRMCDETVEISMQKLTAYPGNYSFFVEAKAERSSLQQKAYDNQQKYLQDQQRFIDRFKAKASKAKQAQSKMKQLDKIERVDMPEEEDFDLSIRFKVKTPSGREVLALKNIVKSYGEKHVIKGGEVSIQRGDKIALIGANGLGKSTILRIMAEMEPFKGERKVGHNVQPAFFAQHQLEALNLQNTLLQEVVENSNGKTEMELRAILGCFMFSGDEVMKKISVLSGGEKSRTALAKVLISEANFLLLDEPTNHLDIPSIQILIQALQNYEGTFVVISHDRHFLSQVGNKIWYIEEGILKEYPGTYEEFEVFKQAQAAALVAPKNAPIAPEKKKPQSETPVDYEAQKQQKNKLRKLEREQEELETQIAALEVQKKDCLAEIANPAFASQFAKIRDLQDEMGAIEKEISRLTEKWEKVIEEIESFA